MLFLLVFAYLVIGAVALAHVAKKDEEQSKGQTPPGNVIVEMFWDKATDADVDLWVQAPGDVPVGYSNKSGAIFNLVRDDLGKGRRPQLDELRDFLWPRPLAGRICGERHAV
jgi:hypothetical protein